MFLLHWDVDTAFVFLLHWDVDTPTQADTESKRLTVPHSYPSTAGALLPTRCLETRVHMQSHLALEPATPTVMCL